MLHAHGLRLDNAGIMPLHSKIRRAIGAAALTQKRVAESLGVSETAVSKWCKGKSVPELDRFVALVLLTGVSADWLIRDDLDETPIVWAAAPPEPPGRVFATIRPGPAVSPVSEAPPARTPPATDQPPRRRKAR
jgi:transcriptional regulator with XRE-family HTH domain